MNELQQYAGELENRASGIGADLAVLCGAHSEAARAFAAVEEGYREDWRRMAGGRGGGAPTLAILGDSNCRALVAELLIGDAAGHGRAERVHWFGQRMPEGLDKTWEEAVVRQPAEMADLGREYLLAVAPALHPAEEHPWLPRVLSSVRFVVLVVEAAKSEASAWKQRIAPAQGKVVLPVVLLPSEDKETSVLEAEWRSEWEEKIEPRLAEEARNVRFDPPVFLPDPDAANLGGRRRALPVLRGKLSDGLRVFFERHTNAADDRRPELEASWQRFLAETRSLADGFNSALLRERSAELEKEIAAMPRVVLGRMLSGERAVTALFRQGLREELMERIPVWAFPFRSMVSLLCLTTGAWDRLVLASAGSIASTVLTVAGAARRRADEAMAQQTHGEGAMGRFAPLIRERLFHSWEGFSGALRKASPEDASAPDRTVPDFEIHGEESLISAWKEAARDALQEENGRGWRGFEPMAALAGMLLFLSLVLGPVIHIYALYAPAAWASLTNDRTAVHLAEYPAVSAGFWFMVLVLSLIPAFVVAMAVVAVRVSGSRVKRCVAALRTRIERGLNDGVWRLDVIPREPRIAAYRRLAKTLDFHAKP